MLNTPASAADEGEGTERRDTADAQDVDGAGANPEVTSRIAMATFPEENARPFWPGEFAVGEDLFTHRGPESPNR